MRQKFTFASGDNELSGLLELPESDTRCYALFAHCFSCGKDIAAASRVSRALAQHGIAVLRFDFTGLGNSDGDFANTNFSSNLDDLVAAADYLREHYAAPTILIGHSLGGAAVLAMARRVPEAAAVVTIAAPYRADHVLQNFADELSEIKREGEVEVSLGGRRFPIRKQFLDDLANHDTMDLGKLKKALLIMHSPVDTTVAIDEAEKIYREAKHPKSFISLDNADHLLTLKADARYAADALAGWVSRYIPSATGKDAKPAVSGGHVLVSEKDHKFTQHVASDAHYWLADEPLPAGGQNLGPDPYEHLLAALGTCTAMTLRMYAQRRSLPLEDVQVELRHDREHQRDCEDCEQSDARVDVIYRQLTLVGELSVAQQEKLLEIADKCPVHKTLHNHLQVSTSITKG